MKKIREFHVAYLTKGSDDNIVMSGKNYNAKNSKSALEKYESDKLTPSLNKVVYVIDKSYEKISNH
jgi:hypothetical protein